MTDEDERERALIEPTCIVCRMRWVDKVGDVCIKCQRVDQDDEY